MNNSEIKLKQYFLNRQTYELLDQAGTEIIPGWNIMDFEKGLLSAKGLNLPEPQMEEMADKVERLISSEKPVTWQKTFTWTLFTKPPGHWGTRGVPFAWNALSRKVSALPLPQSREELKASLLAAAKSLELPMEGDEYRFFSEFSTGGMNSGYVGARFVEEAIDELCRRL